jgi:hypothetical protein
MVRFFDWRLLPGSYLLSDLQKCLLKGAKADVHTLLSNWFFNLGAAGCRKESRCECRTIQRELSEKESHLVADSPCKGVIEAINPLLATSGSSWPPCAQR